MSESNFPERPIPDASIETGGIVDGGPSGSAVEVFLARQAKALLSTKDREIEELRKSLAQGPETALPDMQDDAPVASDLPPAVKRRDTEHTPDETRVLKRKSTRPHRTSAPNHAGRTAVRPVVERSATIAVSTQRSRLHNALRRTAAVGSVAGLFALPVVVISGVGGNSGANEQGQPGLADKKPNMPASIAEPTETASPTATPSATPSPTPTPSPKPHKKARKRHNKGKNKPGKQNTEPGQVDVASASSMPVPTVVAAVPETNTTANRVPTDATPNAQPASDSSATKIKDVEDPSNTYQYPSSSTCTVHSSSTKCVTDGGKTVIYK